jgi:uncharacterized protein DUF4342
MRAGWESFRVQGEELVERVRQLVHEGNVQRIVIKQGDRTIAEFPVTVGVVGALAAPALAAVGALAAFVSDCTVEVRRAEARPAAAGPPKKRTRPARKAAGRRR